MGETLALVALNSPALIPLESLPVGYRFHPTDEELINDYLKRKIDGRIKPCDAAVIPEVDVCRFEPWDLPDKSPIRSRDPEWFFFAPVDRKYPTGNRSNRSTEGGFWKATGKDRMIKSRVSDGPTTVVVGMKKTLVFHRGRAPNGTRTNWIMHEYRTVEPVFESDQGDFVLCRLFRKPEDTLLCSSSNEFQRTGFSSPNISSPGSILSGASPHSDLLKKLLSLPEITVKERAGGVDEVKHSIPHPSKPEEKQCTGNRISDVGDHEAQTFGEAVSRFTNQASKANPLTSLIPSLELAARSPASFSSPSETLAALSSLRAAQSLIRSLISQIEDSAKDMDETMHDRGEGMKEEESKITEEAEEGMRECVLQSKRRKWRVSPSCPAGRAADRGEELFSADHMNRRRSALDLVFQFHA